MKTEVERMATEMGAIRKIANRAADIYATNGRIVDPDYIASEIMFVHEVIVRLRLADMKEAMPSDLMHDVAGIHQHLDISTEPPSFTRCFVPRFAEHQVSRSA